MPEILRRRYLGDFLIYTKAEADEADIVYKAWYDAEEGEFGLSDDGYVSICRSRKVYPMKSYTTYEVKYPFGVFLFKEDNKGVFNYSKGCLYLERKAKRHSFGIASAKTFGERCVKNKKIRKMIRIASRMLVDRGTVDYEYLGAMFFKKDLLPHLSVQKVLKKKEVKEFMEEEVIEILGKYGIDDKTVVQRCFVQAIEIAEKNKDADILVKVGIELAKLRNMYPQKKIVTSQFEATRNTEYLDNVISKEENKLLVQQTEEAKI